MGARRTGVVFNTFEFSLLQSFSIPLIGGLGLAFPALQTVLHGTAVPGQAGRRWLSTAVSSGSAFPARSAFLLGAFNLPSLPEK